MKIRFLGDRPRDVVGPPSFTADPGGEYDVSDRLGAALCQQPRWFEKVAPPAPRKAESKPKESTP